MSTSTSTQPESTIKPSPGNWKTWRMVVSVVAILVAIGVSIFWGSRQKAQEGFFGQRLFPDKIAYDFHLVDQNGKPFQLSQLRGKAVLFSFGYTHCADICPTTLTNLAGICKALPPGIRKKVQVLFISVDPRRDQPQMLRKYIPYFDPSFIGLTGSKEAIDNAAKAYGVTYEFEHTPGEDPDVYTVDHSTYIYLVNPAGKLELIYDNDKIKDTPKMVSDIDRILNSNGNG